MLTARLFIFDFFFINSTVRVGIAFVVLQHWVSDSDFSCLLVTAVDAV